MGIRYLLLSCADVIRVPIRLLEVREEIFAHCSPEVISPREADFDAQIDEMRAYIFLLVIRGIVKDQDCIRSPVWSLSRKLLR